MYTIVVPAAEDGWTAASTLVCGASSVALVAGFLVRQDTAAAPLMPLRIFASRTVAGANVVQVLGTRGMFGAFFLGTLYLQQVLGYGPLEIGLAFLPVDGADGRPVGAATASRLMTRFGAQRVMVTGLLSSPPGWCCFAIAPAQRPVPGGRAAGDRADRHRSRAVLPADDDAGDDGVRPSDAGLASGLVNTTGQVGGALGLSILATVSIERSTTLRESGSAVLDAMTGGYHAAFWIAMVLILAAVATALTVLRPARTAPEPAVEPAEDELLPAAA